MKPYDFSQLSNFLTKVPSIDSPIYSGVYDDGNWWVKFSIDISNKLAWNVVQELGHLLNYLSLEEKLPTVFYPVSAPPYMNGGPAEFLYWIIESKDPDFSPEAAMEWLEGRLPNPINNSNEWLIED
jgi:hypothetical protein